MPDMLVKLYALPELGDLSLSHVLALAVSRHEDLTGTTVSLDMEGLPASANVDLKICAYRVIQEALSNAFRHGGGVGQRVEASVADEVLHLEISNARGQGATSTPADGRLGLRGMRFRVEALGGRLDVDFETTGRSQVIAAIPMRVGRDQT